MNNPLQQELNTTKAILIEAVQRSQLALDALASGNTEMAVSSLSQPLSTVESLKHSNPLTGSVAVTSMAPNSTRPQVPQQNVVTEQVPSTQVPLVGIAMYTANPNPETNQPRVPICEVVEQSNATNDPISSESEKKMAIDERAPGDEANSEKNKQTQQAKESAGEKVQTGTSDGGEATGKKSVKVD